MFGVSLDGLVVMATLLALLQTGIQARFQDYKTSPTLPTWRTDSDYITRCNFNDDATPFCDWMSEGLLRELRGTDERYLAPERSSGVARLESPVLGVSGEACLEFWYQAPLVPNGSELKVLLNGINGQSEVWTLPVLDGEVWRLASIPLSSVDQRQVVFEAEQRLQEDQQVAFGRVTVSRGQCGRACDSDREFWTDKSTRCQCSAGALSCDSSSSSSSSSSCPEGQTCDAQSRVPGPARGTCTVDSKPRCSTFDGAVFEVVVPCTYLLAGTCWPEEALPAFKVEVVNKPGANSSVSPVVRVDVQLDNLRLTLHHGETGRVMVNGVWKTLPLNLDDKNVKVRGNRVAVVMKTRHGLFVSYHLSGAVRVTVPDSYSGKVCGMCGNFNHLKSDDYRAPASPESPAEDLASCEATLVPRVCNPLVEVQYASEAHCGGLLSGTGPFAGCHPLLEAESFFRGCVAEMCAASGDPAALCEALESYASACRDAGVTLPAWRNSTVCPLVCGPNSHYNPCAEGCPEACSSQDALGACGSCTERCECDPGFKLSGGSCVQAEDCGCWRNGEHHKSGATFMEGECERQCTCTGNDRVVCSAATCGAGEVCGVKDGVKECHAARPVMCRVYGDPHYTTFDGKAYTFQGGCNYTLTTTCGGHTPVQFSVTGRNQYPANGSRSKLEAVALHVSGLHVTVETSGGKEVLVNGSRVSLPFNAAGSFGSLEVSRDRAYTVVATSFGVRLMTDGRDRLFLQVDDRYYGEMCGLCGAYSGHQDDDFLKPDGSHASTASEFGHSWRVEDDEHSSCVAFPDEPRRCEGEEADKAMEECSALLGDAFQPCLGPVHPQTYLTSCVSDYCSTAGDREVLCGSLESYVAACQVAGVELVDWRNGTACAVPPVPPTPGPVCPAIHCNFDDNLCGWQQLVQDSFDWTRLSGPTPTDLTGPSRDHTTGAGSYMYTEGDGSAHGDPARLMSPPCLPSGPVCLSFWYHMHGDAQAMAVNVYLIQGNTNKKLWSRVNAMGPEWHRADIDIRVDGLFLVLVEGIRGSTYRSDVAIDDVAVQAGPCSGSPGLIRATVPFLPVKAEVAPSHPAATFSVCNLECTFDDHLCGWSQMITDAFDWTRQSGYTPTSHTGPSEDHNGGGHYLYVESSSVTHGDTARLLSSECSDSGPQCLQFWYHMHGSAQTMGLQVYLLQGRLANAVWWKRDDQGDAWHLAQVDITASGPFQVIFEGRRGSNEESDVAIDDVSLHAGRCSDLVISTTTEAPTTSRPTSTTAPDCNTQPGITTNVPETTVTPTTPEPYPPTTPEPHPPTTPEPHPPITPEPHPPTTPEQDPPITAEPYPPTTAEPHPPTTPDPHPPTTADPHPPTTGEPHPPTTPEPHPPTTAEPHPPTTAEPHRPTTAETQPPTTTTKTPVPTTVNPTPSCPKNSHYTSCLPACNPSCQHLHGPPNCNVEEPCVAGCACDDSFVLRQRVCVPIQQCGCVDRNGDSYHFKEVWYTKHCSQKCECEEDDGVGEIDCDDDKNCDRDEVCLQNEAGQHYCKSTDFSECSVNGDPEYRTFDDLKHEFEGRESYVLVQTTGLPQNLPAVYIEGVNKAVRDYQGDDEKNGGSSSDEGGVPRDTRGRGDSSEEEEEDSSEEDEESREDDSDEVRHRQRLRGLKIRVYNHTVEFKKNRKVILDGVRTRVPVHPSGGLKIMERSSRLYLKTDFGLSVEFNGDSKAEIILPHTYKRKVGGLCGNFDGRRKNDLMKPDGNQAKGVQEFGQSWRVTQDSLSIKWRRSSSINTYGKARD